MMAAIRDGRARDRARRGMRSVLRDGKPVPDRTVHGLSRSKEYGCWGSMKERCYYPKTKSHRRYSEAGITVCDRWLNGDGERSGFECFYADMGPAPTKRHTLDRRDNTGNYEPANCRWATWTEQQRNRTITGKATFMGVTRPIAEWAEVVGINYERIRYRLAKGWPVERALTEPVNTAKIAKRYRKAATT